MKKGKIIGKYHVQHVLGTGNFGKVYFATNSEDESPWAIKVLDKKIFEKNEKMRNQLRREIEIITTVNHANIMKVKEAISSSTKIFLVLEYLPNGTLQDELERSGGRFSEDRARAYVRQISEGMDYCHSLGVCHRDLSKYCCHNSTVVRKMLYEIELIIFVITRYCIQNLRTCCWITRAASR
jgi:serine/threonine protein kinase